MTSYRLNEILHDAAHLSVFEASFVIVTVLSDYVLKKQ